jgi:CubicO group peptidase (beta-lactamase class C family)
MKTPKYHILKVAALSTMLSLLVGCESGFVAQNSDTAPTGLGDLPPAEPPTPICTPDTLKLETQMNETLTNANSDYDFSYQIERADGRKYVFNWKGATPDTVRESASTSKMVTGLVIMRLVEKGILKLTDRPQDYIADWPVPAGDPLENITLEHLLSFRSGLIQDPQCSNSGNADFEACVRAILDLNLGKRQIPGEQFNYSGSHLQVAGLMAIKASGKKNWGEVFDEYRAATGAFPHGVYDLPSALNPRLAGGMHWTGAEYLDFLRLLKNGKLLSPETMQIYLVDRTAAPVTIGNSPALKGIGEDWHYGAGFWQECQSPTFNCVAAKRISSPGAYGAYPFWDREHNHIGILSIQTEVGGFRYGTSQLERLVEETANQWAACQ